MHYYLADDIYLASEISARSIRFSSGRKCYVTCVHSRFGDRYFAAAGPRIWNNLGLLASLRDKEVSCTEFRRQLKTFIFQTDCGASWLFWLLRLINSLTCLLTCRRPCSDFMDMLRRFINCRIIIIITYLLNKLLFCRTHRPSTGNAPHVQVCRK